MAEEDVGAAAVAGEGPTPSDHKRKIADLEPQAPKPAKSTHSEPVYLNLNSELNGVKNADEAVVVAVTDESEAKRPRLDEKPDGVAVSENGCQKQPIVENDEIEDTQDTHKKDQETVENGKPETNNHETGDTQHPFVGNPELSETEKAAADEMQQPSAQMPKEEDVSYAEQQPISDNETSSRKMEVPNNKVGVLIGKAGDTIRMLQYNSGAKIQIMRDLDADPYAATRPVELTGSLENINKAEKLIKDVIAEADAGGSPSLVARGFATPQAAGALEEIQIQVPNEKVGLIIGRGGETIKSLQTRSGARIQMTPQHLPEGDQSKERTVRVSGDKKQIELARELIKEVMSQPVRPPLSTGSNQQAYRPGGPGSHSQWGPRGPHPAQPTAYDYQHRGPYPSQNSQYPPQTYGNYPQQQLAPRSGFGSGWEHRPSGTMQGPPQSGGHYYGGPGGHAIDGPMSAPHSASIPSHGPGPSPAPSMGPPHSQVNYNYGQPHGPEYGQPGPYSQTAAPQQSYGYEQMKYENQAPTQHPYGGHGSSQPVYPQAAAQSGYAPQQLYGKPPSYGMPSQGHPLQSYGPPRASQPGDCQGPISSTQSYGQNVAPQQQYPYASGGLTQQPYPAYGSQPAADGYNQPPPASGTGFPQQGGQQVQGYGQPGGHQAPSYAQGGSAAGYGSYPSSQPGSTNQPTSNNAGYGYQGTADPSYSSGPGSAYGAPPSSQPGYAQVPAQPGYDQSVPQSAGYGSIPGSAPVGYGKSASPRPGCPQYDSTQMYGTPR